MPTELPESSHRVRHQLELVLDGSGQCLIVPLVLERTLVGSSQQAQVVLEHDGVAPLHAEFVRGAFGSFRVRSLSKAAVVCVGGQPITDKLVEPGEEIRLGPYTLRILTRSSAEYGFVLPPSSEMALSVLDPGATRHPALEAEHLASVMRLGRVLAQTPGARARLQCLCDRLVASPVSAHSAVALRIRGGSELEVLRGATASGVADELSVPRSLIDRLRETRGPVMDVANGLSVAACPLDVDLGRVDALFVSFSPSHATTEWLSLVTLAAEAHRQAEVVWEMRTHVRDSARLERELEMAREIQEGLVPRPSQFDGILHRVDIAVGFEACRWVGGDYVDAVELRDGRLLLAIADVCGKGMQAALVASAVHTATHVIAAYTTSISDLLERINLHLCNYLPPYSFVTMACVALDLTTGSFEYASAGHPPAMIGQPGGTVELLHHGDNPALGVMDTRMSSRTATLGCGETLFLYTDGLSDVLNERGEPFSIAQLAEVFSDVLVRNPQATARETQSALVGALRDFRRDRPSNDDTTFLVARRRDAEC